MNRKKVVVFKGVAAFSILKEFFRKDKWLTNLAFLAGIIIIVIALPILLDFLKISIKQLL